MGSNRTASGRARITANRTLIDAIDKKLWTFPGITFNYTQPAEDAVDEAETGLKSALDVKVFGTDLAVLEQQGQRDQAGARARARHRRSHPRPGVGQPALTVTVDRAKIARYGINAGDVNALIEAAVGGGVATQVEQGERLYDLVVRLRAAVPREPAADRQHPRSRTRWRADPAQGSGRRSQVSNGASFIYRQDNSRFIGIQYSVDGRDLASAVQEAQRQVAASVGLPPGYRVVWGGEYQEYTASRGQLRVILPLTLFVIFLLLFVLYGNFKFPFITRGWA